VDAIVSAIDQLSKWVFVGLLPCAHFPHIYSSHHSQLVGHILDRA